MTKVQLICKTDGSVQHLQNVILSLRMNKITLFSKKKKEIKYIYNCNFLFDFKLILILITLNIILENALLLLLNNFKITKSPNSL
jgi:hypothetical protein